MQETILYAEEKAKEELDPSKIPELLEQLYRMQYHKSDRVY